jgi:hypothetical protein
MTVNLDNSYLLALYGSSTSSSDMASLLGSSSSAVSAAANAAAAAAKKAPTAPWSVTLPADQAAKDATAAVKAALAGHKLIDEDAAQLDVKGASTDYKKLFALYNGLNTLTDLANRYQAKGVTGLEKTQISKAFDKGMAELSKYIDTSSFDQLRLAQGEANTSAKSTLTIAKPATTYVTGKALTSSVTEEVPAFQGDVKFDIKINRVNVDHTVSIDLSQMTAPRTMGNVVNFINDKLAADGVETRLASVRTPGQPRTVTAGGKTITLPATSDSWSLNVKVGTSETVSFDAPSAGAVYVAQNVGDPDPDGKSTTNDGVTARQLLKFQTDTTNVQAPTQMEGEANFVDGRVFAQTLDPNITAVHAQTVGPDGSVYMLADIDGTVSGQAIKGDQDTALLKYDSAGKLIYTRTLGAAGSATGLALAVSADGQVAVAGSVTGALGGAIEGALNSGPTRTTSDSFVTLYDDEGSEVWTERRGAREDDEASQVAFGADGAVYVAGRAKSVMQGTTAIGGWDSYVEGFKADAKGKVTTLFSQSFGTPGTDKPQGLVVDGSSLVTAANEDGHAVLRRFDISSGAPVLSATRDLGDLQGGDIAGLALDGGQLVVAGTTRNGSLSAGNVTRAYAGGSDAFAAKIGASLSGAPSDAIASYGGAGDDKAASLAVAGGQVWIGGSAGTDLPDLDKVGKKDGFLAQLDVATGDVAWSRRFTGKDNMATPTAIAVDPTGASVLDRLGLPKGTLDLKPSDKITDASGLRAGDQFTISTGSGVGRSVTVEAADTLDTLAQKIRRASGFQAKVTISTVNGARQLRIEPNTPRVVLEIGAGKANANALKMLGIPEGVVRATEVGANGKLVAADDKPNIYGLSLPSDLNLSNAAQIGHALAELTAAQGVVRTAYKDLQAAADPGAADAAAKAAAANGPVPAYLTNQIANYQAALSRLTGGG